MRLAGEHCIVTGGASGIGKAISLLLAKNGAKVSILARNETKMKQTVAEIVAAGGEAQYFSCDIQSQSAIEEAVLEAVTAFGALRAMIANAGIGGSNQAGEEDRFDAIVQTNLSGTYYSFRAAEKHLKNKDSARQLIAISSCLARFGVPGYTAYCASKAGILGLVRALSLELAQQNVQVNALCPGWVNTQMARDGLEEMATGMGISYEEAYRIAMKSVPLGRMSEPEEIASYVLWLILEGQSITGQGLDINAGSWMG